MRILFVVLALLLGCAGCATSDDYPRRPSAQEMANLEGLYTLSDGYRAHVVNLDERLYVTIGAGSPKMLETVAPDRFASPNGDVTIQLQPERDGDDAERIVVEYYRKPGGHPPRIFSTGPLPGRGFVD
jgi:hypothetical protein